MTSTKLLFNCLTKKYFQFKGRANRKEFLLLIICNILLKLILEISYFILGQNAFWLTMIISPILIFLFIPSITVTIRRLHDFNISGWYYFFFNCFLIIITIYLMVKDGSIKREIQMSTETLIFTYLTFILQYLALSCIRGNHGINKYGEPPSE